MKNELLLIEKSKYQIQPSSGEDMKYTFEGVFTEFDNENRNGRVYTKKEFQPHFTSLKKIVEAGKCLGELDHPKQFETTLKNVSHIIEKVWMDEDNNRVMGRIKLLDTDAGKQAKALVDAEVPLHISSRAAGTVTENKTVKIHKLFTYDLVDTPGFENAVMNSVNESYGFENTDSTASNFLIFDIDESSNEFTKSVNKSELNKTNKNKTENVNEEYIKEQEFNGFSEYTKEKMAAMTTELSELKGIQESIIKQNDHMVDEFNKSDSSKDSGLLETISKKIEAIEKWSDHVVSEFKSIKESAEDTEEELEDSVPSKFEVGKSYKDYGTVRSVQNSEDGGVEVWFDDNDEPTFFPVKESVEVIDKDKTTNKGGDSKEEKEFGQKTVNYEVGGDYKGSTITQIERTEDGQIKLYLDSEDEPVVIGSPDGGTEEIKIEEKLDILLQKFDAIQNWANHVTETVTALEKWSDHTTDTVTGVEKWSNHVTESVTAIEKWSDEATTSVTRLEESSGVETKGKLIKESKDMEDFKSSIFERIENIVDAKKQGAETLNESKVTEEIEKVEESVKPLWLEQLPAKYEQTWESLEESEKTKIAKRAELREFKTSNSIREFWNVTFTKENLIKKEEPKKPLNGEQLNAKRQAMVESYRATFGK